MNRFFLVLHAVAVLPACAPDAGAGGSGLNVAIVVNQNSSNSVQLGNYYREQRQVPPQNLLRINWTGGNIAWSLSDFTNVLLNPVGTQLAARQLTNQIDYLVLSMDIPYRVSLGGSEDNATTAALHYGFKPDPNPPCSLAPGSTSAYAGSEDIFRATPPLPGYTNSFLVTMITAGDLATAKQIVDAGVLSDATFPTQPVLLGKSTDWARNIRYAAFDNALFNTRLRGNYSMLRTNVYQPPMTNLLGYANGSYGPVVPANTFVHGAMADSLTSFGGQIFEYTSGQTTALAFLAGGAAGSYGTVTEPCNYPQKFPDPQIYFLQARGFSLAECYYQGVTNPYQGSFFGEPLAAPFAQPGTGSWTGLPLNAVLAGRTNLALQFNASDLQHPLQQVDLFVDGLWLETVTNLAPAAGNQVNVTVNGHPFTYVVPANATVKSVASGVADLLNAASGTTAVSAMAHGDRIELQATDGVKTGAQLSLTAGTAQGAASALTTFAQCSRTNFLDTIAWGVLSCEVSNAVASNSVLQITVIRTNGAIVTLSATNDPANSDLLSFIQQFANLINASPALQDDGGLTAEDVYPNDVNDVTFNLRARSTGYAAARIQASLGATAGLTALPVGTNALMTNLSDLQPRNHLYLTAGATNLAPAFALDTTLLADGWHELTAVACEGSHVRTQTRATQTILVRNTPLSAVFTTLMGGTNTALEATLQFAVTASTSTISRIELFSTGGSLAVVTNQPSATFSIAATNLGLGLHPFYALVTATNGSPYRTETKWFRLVGPEPRFALHVSTPPPTLLWPATAGRRYDILSTTNPAGAFQLRDTVTPTNSTAQWVETNPGPPQLFYRIRVSP